MCGGDTTKDCRLSEGHARRCRQALRVFARNRRPMHRLCMWCRCSALRQAVRKRRHQMASEGDGMGAELPARASCGCNETCAAETSTEGPFATSNAAETLRKDQRQRRRVRARAPGWTTPPCRERRVPRGRPLTRSTPGRRFRVVAPSTAARVAGGARCRSAGCQGGPTSLRFMTGVTAPSSSSLLLRRCRSA